VERGCRYDIIRLGLLVGTFCVLILYYIGLQWVQHNPVHIFALFGVGSGLCVAVLLVYWLRTRRFTSPPQRVSWRVLLLLVGGAVSCVYSILYMQTVGWYWRPRIAGAVTLLLYAVAAYVVWYRPYKLTAPKDDVNMHR
jgi:hypothetical protein